ncbi:hypothetical protein SAMN05660909_05423 [Chitinophaga terrae (ex Kim and Jung 2007)]|uniref:Uncharacterized protein n=1 Tax=Chitinophaga terrae (ex Kim and Jung 2007) TaxID=408074 RepID=A0A1H4GLE1_9BACT|nr:hypothetical protein [Chitinophaga terrae (ex Kim and Jung 2007)]GEP93521.1 hypothetical protein CTE07_51660 [Chitinophaga terrae (ex Kim and Jung 2007)]SEB09668.1 hypothetical protein SAMN05660909_05423 [Chitinophaga terrae (ex Kim and Jung 2007)]
MNTFTEKWLNISIYYSQEKWPQLFKRCLNPLLNELKQKDNNIIKSILLFCSTDKGDNIQFFVQIASSYADEHINFVMKGLKTYIAENPSVRKASPRPTQQFFMDYPNNSIVDNISRPDLAEVWKNDYLDVQSFISELLAKEFEDDQIDEEAGFSFALYLVFVLFKVKLTGNKEEISTTITCFLETKEVDYKEKYFFKDTEIKKITGLVQAVYQKNTSVIDEIYLDVWKESSTLLWIADWKELLYKYFNNVSLINAYNIILPLLQYHLNLHDINSKSIANWITATITNHLNEGRTNSQ